MKLIEIGGEEKGRRKIARECRISSRPSKELSYVKINGVELGLIGLGGSLKVKKKKKSKNVKIR